MARKWQEIEFLDYRDRQVRRRTRKTRALVEASQTSSGPSATFVLRAGAVLLAIALAVVGISRLPVGTHLLATPHLTATAISGTVEYSTPTVPWTAVKPGDTFDKDVSLRVGEHGRLTLATPLPKSKIVAQSGTLVTLTKIEVNANAADMIAMRFKPEKGVILFDFKAGQPLVEMLLPQGTTVKGGMTRGAKQATFKVDVGSEESKVLLRDGVILLKSADSSRIAHLQPDMLMAIKKGDRWDAPSRFNSTLESWE